MNRSIRHTFLAATTACGLWLTPATAQTTATTDPVGAMSFSVLNEADRIMGIPLQQPNSFAGSVANVSSSGVTLESDPGDLISDAHYLLVTSGQAAGIWRGITAQSGSTLTLDFSIPSLAPGDSVEAVPYWTLNSLFPEGVSPEFVTTNLASPSGLILAFDPTASGTNIPPSSFYFYFSGSAAPDGWYDLNTGTSVNDLAIPPDSPLVIRNLSGESLSVMHSGEVRMSDFSADIVGRAGGRQDNIIGNPFAVRFPLNQYGLVASGSFSVTSNLGNLGDILLVYEPPFDGKNPVPTKQLFYFDDGGGTSGWFDLSTGADMSDYSVPVGGALVVRKAPNGGNVDEWIIPNVASAATE